MNRSHLARLAIVAAAAAVALTSCTRPVAETVGGAGEAQTAPSSVPATTTTSRVAPWTPVNHERLVPTLRYWFESPIGGGAPDVNPPINQEYWADDQLRCAWQLLSSNEQIAKTILRDHTPTIESSYPRTVRWLVFQCFPRDGAVSFLADTFIADSGAAVTADEHACLIRVLSSMSDDDLVNLNDNARRKFGAALEQTCPSATPTQDGQ